MKLVYENVESLCKVYVQKLNDLAKLMAEEFPNSNKKSMVEAYTLEFNYFYNQIRKKYSIQERLDNNRLKLERKRQKIEFDFEKKKEKFDNKQMKILNYELLKIHKKNSILDRKQKVSDEKLFFDDKKSKFDAEREIIKKSKQAKKENKRLFFNGFKLLGFRKNKGENSNE